jgi:hypothetical protein
MSNTIHCDGCDKATTFFLHDGAYKCDRCHHIYEQLRVNAYLNAKKAKSLADARKKTNTDLITRLAMKGKKK